MGEYIRYTRDFNWLEKSKEKILKACDYLIQWRNQNKKEELRKRLWHDRRQGGGSGRQLSSIYVKRICLSRIIENCRSIGRIDPYHAKLLREEADEWKRDILETVNNRLAASPVVPLGDGRWIPALPPWAEGEGPRFLYQKKETFWSHGTFTISDALLGPLNLVFCEIIEPKSQLAKMILDYHGELLNQGNNVFSEPFYSRYNWLQVKLGRAKPFLNTYYHNVSAHADRETYTFWEHMYRISPHKTHEEAWFLMETRWMLYMEEEDTLNLFKTIPRRWLEKGNTISLKDVRSYFGKLDVLMKSDPYKDLIHVSVICNEPSKPKNQNTHSTP